MGVLILHFYCVHFRTLPFFEVAPTQTGDCADPSQDLELLRTVSTERLYGKRNKRTSASLLLISRYPLIKGEGPFRFLLIISKKRCFKLISAGRRITFYSQFRKVDKHFTRSFPFFLFRFRPFFYSVLLSSLAFFYCLSLFFIPPPSNFLRQSLTFFHTIVNYLL